MITITLSVKEVRDILAGDAGKLREKAAVEVRRLALNTTSHARRKMYYEFLKELEDESGHS